MPFEALRDRDISSTRKELISYYPLTCAEYFAGIGLVRLGLEQAGWEIRFSNDWERSKFEMYSAYFKDASQHYKIQDIFSVCPAEIPDTLLATASFPCIDLSLAGNLEGIRGQHSSAFWGFTQILEGQVNRPKLVMLENVVGWLTSNSGKDFRIAIQELNRLGYACDVFTIDASHFVPQSRPRIFVIGTQIFNPNQDIFTYLKRSCLLRTKALERVVLANLDLQWHFLEIPSLPNKQFGNLANVLENIPDEDDRWWSEGEVKRHLNMMSSADFTYLQQLEDLPLYSYCTMYRRVREGKQRAELRKDGLAGCLRTARGGSSKQMLVRVGKRTAAMRLMTPREYARLQGVPEDYPIPPKINQALTGFGDAVCVPVITWIGRNILNPLVKSLQENTLALRH
jgi:DNA (cytosine-5)-methyltransferase 1